MLLFPKEARWIRDKKKTWIKEHVWADVPGEWLRERAQSKQWKRLGVYGLISSCRFGITGRLPRARMKSFRSTSRLTWHAP